MDQPMKSSILGKKPKLPIKDPLSDDLKELTSSLRVIEERHTNLRKKSQVIEQNMLSSYKRYGQKVRDAAENIQELKKAVRKIEETLERIESNISGCANKQDIKAIQKYVYMWNPTSFVQRSEVEKMIKQKEKL